ncbi:hypothetical protein TNCT_39391 [Trichonephila clavata]|uniref:Uncharacterized protein n=1 Tax=Trichonephila clavata TaxID=2740835 RepID=A0A8X6LKV9_TRICU|nr:hypothetical protein TNCT_39391 [Trichonephila clavata]
MRFICPKHSVKPVVLLFHFIEYQFRKLSARFEVRRFQFLVMLQLVGIPSKVIRSALQTLPYDTPVCLETSRGLHSPRAATADINCTACSTVVATAAAVEGVPL